MHSAQTVQRKSNRPTPQRISRFLVLVLGASFLPPALWTAAASPAALEPPLERGRRLHDEGDYEAALKVYREALSRGTDGGALLHQSALASLAAGRSGEATAFARKAVRAAPEEDPAYHSLLGMLLDRANQWRAGASAYREGLKHWPDDPNLRYNLGVNLMTQGQLDSAEAAFSRSLVTRPDHLHSYRQLATLMSKRQLVTAELLARRRALDIDPRAPTAERDAKRSWTLLSHAVAVGRALDEGAELPKQAPGSRAARDQAVMRLIGLVWPTPPQSQRHPALQFANQLDSLFTLMSDQQLMMRGGKSWERSSLAHFDGERRAGRSLSAALSLCELAGKPVPGDDHRPESRPAPSSAIRIAREPAAKPQQGLESLSLTERAAHAADSH